MRKQLYFSVFLALLSFAVNAQNAIVGAGFAPGWGGSCGSNSNFVYFTASAGSTYTSGPLSANGTGVQYWRFGTDWSGTIRQTHLNSTGTDVAVVPNTTYTSSAPTTCVSAGAMNYNVPNTATYKYIFKTKDATASPSGVFVFFEVQGTVRSVSSVSQYPISSGVSANQPVAVTATLDGALSTGQAVYLRYTTNAYSTSTVVQMTGSGTSYSATIPATANAGGAAVSYYVFTSGNANVAADGSNADLYTINLNNNAGSNYSYTVAAAATIYLHNFGTVAISGHPYTVSPTATSVAGTLDANLSSSSWANNLTVPAWSSAGGASGNAIVIAPTTTVTSSITLTFNVASGYACSISSFNFWRQKSGSGIPTINSMTINGTTVMGSNTVPTTGAAIGTTTVSSAVNGLTGTITVVLNLAAPAAGGGNLRLDDFTLNGSVYALGLPTVTTPTATTIANTSATLGATVTSAGASSLTARGTSFKTSSPVVATDNQLAEGGTSVAAYSHSRTGLSSQTQYFYVGYATNSVGTSISAEGNFRTLSNPPTAQASGLAGTPTSTTNINLAWTAATFPGSGATQGGYLILYSTGTPALIASPNGLAPASVISAGTQIAATATTLPTAPSVAASATGLTANTAYNFLVVPYTWDGTNAATYNYLTASAPTASATTLPTAPTITTTVAASSITNAAASSGGQTITTNGGTISAKGVTWGTSANPTVPSANSTNDGTSSANFTSSITGLSAQTLYNVRAYVTTNGGTGYGNNITFRTLSSPATAQASGLGATPTSTSNINLAWTTATFPGSGATQGGYLILYSTGTPALIGSPNGVAPASAISAGTQIASSATVLPTAPSVAASATGLTANTAYNFLVVPYTWDGTNAATYNYLTASAPTASATTLPNAPTITTTVAASSITNTTASSGGQTITTNSGTISAKGIVWNTSANPTLASNLGSTNDGTSSADFTSSLTGLSPETTYNVRAYVTTNGGTAYGTNITFTTLSNPPTAQASSLSATGTSGTDMSLSWSAATFPGSGATTKGYVLLRAVSPATPTLTSSNGSAPSAGVGTIVSSTISSGATSYSDTGLSASVTYNYLLVPFCWNGTAAATYNYLTSSAPTASGTTLGGTPAVSTNSTSAITTTSATSGGNTVTDGGTSISAKGVVWDTAVNPTVASNLGSTNDGSGTANFTSSITGLSAQTLYHVRAYATNANGTGYGSDVSFRTLSSPATAQASSLSGTPSSQTVIDLAWTGATFPGSGATQGGYLILYSTGTPALIASPNGLAPGSVISAGTQIASSATTLPTAPSVAASATGLSANTAYNFLVVPYTWDGTNAATYNYLTASAPTASATTLPNAPTITTTVAASVITNSTASSGGQTITTNSGTISAKGVTWSTSANPTVPSASSTNDGTSSADFTSSITGMSGQTVYNVRAYVTTNGGTGYGNNITLRTQSNPATAQATALSGTPTSTTAITLNWTGATYPGSGATQGGYLILYSTGTPALIGTPNGLAPTSVISVGTQVSSTATVLPTTPAVTASVTGLTVNTAYNFLVVPYTWDGTNTSTYTYLTASAPTATATTLPNAPTIGTTVAANTITNTTASSGGNTITTNGGTISAKGVVWNTVTNPTTSTSVGSTNDGTSSANFTSSLTGLSPQTQYFVRAYVTTNGGTAYAGNINFRTQSNPPTSSASSLSGTPTSQTAISLSWTGASYPGSGATQGGYLVIYSTGTPAISATPNGVAPASIITNGTQVTLAASVLPTAPTATVSATGLSANTLYNFLVIPYTWDGTNAATYSYYTSTPATGSATTLPNVPSITTTNAATAITNTTATSGGTTLVDNGGAITAKGVVWGASANPTLPGLGSTTDGTGTADFTSSITGLTAQTAYNVRAYATNSGGTGYGTNVAFRTLSNPPTVQATGLTASVAGTTSVTLSWTAATFPASGATRLGYVVIYGTGTPSLSGTNGVTPATALTSGTIFTTATTANPTQPATSVTVTGLTINTTYNFTVIPYTWDNANATTYNYLTTSAPTASATPVSRLFTWIGTGTASWAVSTNWSPTGVPSTNDQVQFTGSTAVDVNNLPTSLTLQSFRVTGTGVVTLQSTAAAGSVFFTIGGGSSPQFQVASGSTLKFYNGTGTGTNDINFAIATGSVGQVAGNLTFGSSVSNSTNNTIMAADAGGLTFQSGSVFTTDTGSATTPFYYAAGVNASTNGTVVFASGSTMIFKEGGNPFALTQPNSKVVFQTGSWYRHQAATSPSLIGRTYANFEYNASGTVNSSGSNAAFICDDFTVSQGTFNMNFTSASAAIVHQIKGNISVASGASAVMGTTSGTCYFNFGGTSVQTISGAGSFGFSSNVVGTIPNTASVKSQMNITCVGSMSVAGTLEVVTPSIWQGAGSFSIANGGTVITSHVLGFEPTGSANGAIQMTTRTYNGANANFGYNGTANQGMGAGPGSSVLSLAINNSGTSGNNVVTIPGSSISVGTLKLQAGLVTQASGTLNINSGGVVNGTGGDFSPTIGALVNFVGTGTKTGGSTVNFQNVAINGGVDFATGSNIKGYLSINSGGYVNTNAPTYDTGSTLRYNSGSSYGRATEWSSTSGAGYPYNVRLMNSTAVDVGNGAPSVARQMAGSLSVDAGSGFYMDFGSNDMSATVTVLGNVDLTGNLSLSQVSGGDIVVQGNWTENSGSIYNDNTRAVFLTGTNTQTITRSGGNTFSYLLLNKTGGSVVLANDVTVSGVLTFQGSNTAIIDAGSNNLIIGSNSTTAVVRTGAGHVKGNLRRAIGSGSNTYNFTVGDATNYTPASLSLVGVGGAGTITASTTATDHPQVATSGFDNTKTVNRYWTLAQSGITLTSYSGTFNFVSGDLDAGVTTANLGISKYASGWVPQTTSSSLSTSTTATGMTSFGDIAIGECKVPNDYSVTGGGAYCSGGTGIAVGLSGSDTWVSYQLYLNGVPSGSPVTGTGSAISFGLQTSAGTYTVYATNIISNVCATNMSGNVGVTITPQVTPAITISSSIGTTICTGQSVTFTAVIANGGTTPAYQWYVNGSPVGTNSSTYTTTSLANGNTVTCLLTSNAVCTTSTTATSNSILITVNPPVTYYVDADGDGYGTGSGITSCTLMVGYATSGGDCVDTNSDIFPGQDEMCNSIDDNCNSSIDEGLVTYLYYRDQDGDGYAILSVSTTGCTAPSGYIYLASTVGYVQDCNDTNSAIHPGATEVADGVDNDCDGSTDEGFGPANDSKSTAYQAVLSNFGSCTFVNGTLLGATASAEAQTTCPTGQDVWYYFTASSGGVAIRVNSTANNILIELQDDSGALVDAENTQSIVGNEVLNYSGLTEGQTYWVCVRNYNSAQGVGGAFSMCVAKLIRSYYVVVGGASTDNYCDLLHAHLAPAYSYVFRLRNTTTNAYYTVTAVGTTISAYNYVTGVVPGGTYEIFVDAVYLVQRGDGVTETVTVTPTITVTRTLNAHASMYLNTAQACPSYQNRYGTVNAQPYICGAIDYQWEFTRTLPSAALPITVTRGANNRSLALGTVPGLALGATYDVRIRPIFPGGNYGAWSTSASCFRIIGPASMPMFEGKDGETTYFERDLQLEAESGLIQPVVYPNPTNGEMVNIAIDGFDGAVQVKVYDSSGRNVIARQEIVSAGSIIEMTIPSELGSGLYTMVFVTDKGSVTRKLMVAR